MGDVIEIDLGGEIEYDFDSLLQGFAGGGGDLAVLPSPEEAWLPNGDAPPSEKSCSPDSNSFSSMGDIEKLLLDGDAADFGGGDEEFSGDFFSDLLAGLDGGEGGASAPEEAEAEADAALGAEEKEKRDASHDVDDDDESVSKKRRRQMRNRDSAMKSRERKKMYVKDLEMKSKFLESECRRLDFALRCCVAENMALRQRLQKERPLGVPVAKQESAVLFMESLLLGSLFWLVSIVCLFLIPDLPIPNQKDASRLGRGPAQEVAGTRRIANEGLGSDIGLELVFMRRRCRGMRTKMKSYLLPSHAISA